MPAVIKQMDIYPLPHHLCKAPAHLSPSPSLDVLANHLRQSANRFACYLTLSDIIMTQGTPYLWALWCHFWHGKGTHSWNHYFQTRRYLSCCIVNTICAYVLATQTSSALATMVLTYLSRTIPVSTAEGLTYSRHCQCALIRYGPGTQISLSIIYPLQ